MSVASEITRLQGAKASIKSAIEAKGVTVPSNALLDSFATYIAQISGGSTGLVYETGTYTPEEDVTRPEILFTNQHTNPPALVAFYDTGQTFPSNNSGIYFNYVDPYRLFNAGYAYNDTPSIRYATVIYGYRGSTSTSISTGTTHCSYNSDMESSSSSHARYYVSPTGFKPYTSSSSRYWRSNRTYKWIAVWK